MKSLAGFEKGQWLVCTSGETVLVNGRMYKVASIDDRNMLRIEGLPGYYRDSRFRAATLEEGLSKLASVAVAANKPSNPKAAIGASKLDFSKVPFAAYAHMATAFYEGASKYGQFNWRVAGVQASTYYAALQRHIGKWWEGQDHDPATKVHHLANAMACCGILLDAELAGMLNDDRPPKVQLDKLLDNLAEVQKHLTTMHANATPQHAFAKKD